MLVWGGYDGTYANTGSGYNPSQDSWRLIAFVPSARKYHSAVWTGTEMIVWSGDDGTQLVNTGGRYNPDTDNWAPTSTGVNVPSGREYHTAVWDNTDGWMIVWGGNDGESDLDTGGRYDPATDFWTPITTENAPSGREYHTAVWDNTDGWMIVWGGNDGESDLDTGGRYDPASDTWTATNADETAPTARRSHTAVWTGTEMIVWGGRSEEHTSEL